MAARSRPGLAHRIIQLAKIGSHVRLSIGRCNCRIVYHESEADSKGVLGVPLQPWSGGFLVAFNHVLTLMAFVFAVSLAQLLIRISALVGDREKVAFSGLSGLAIANAILLVYLNWLAMYELREAGNWSLLSISVMFVFALSICFISTLAAPQLLTVDHVDMDAFYWKQRKTYYSSWIVCETLAIVANGLFANAPLAAKLGAENLLNLAMFPPIILALAVPRRWAQWVGGGALFALNATFLALFERHLV